MIQAFYTAASGMLAQQKNIDVISDNLSNSNTPGYRIRRAEFRELLYSSTQSANKKSYVTAGHGVSVASISTAPIPEEYNPYGMVVGENDYFTIEDSNGTRYYTQNGDFKQTEEGGKFYLTTQKGDYVLNNSGERIELPNTPESFIVTGNTIFTNGNNGEAGISPMVVKFSNKLGLALVMKDKYTESPQSGQPSAVSGYSLESNYVEDMMLNGKVNNMNEMTKLIQTQMGYQVNSKALQIADDIEGMANHLRY